MDEMEEKQKITSPKRLRDLTLKPEIEKKRTEWVKIDIQYNDDGAGVGEGYVQLVSYLGVLAWTMVLVYHTDWRVVPIVLKEKLWDCIKVYSNLLKLFSYILCRPYMLIKQSRSYKVYTNLLKLFSYILCKPYILIK